MTVVAHANWSQKVVLQDYSIRTYAYGSSKLDGEKR